MRWSVDQNFTVDSQTQLMENEMSKQILLVSVQYSAGTYVPTKAAIQMIEAAGHQIVSAPKADVVVVEGRHLPYAAPVVPAVMVKVKELGLIVTDLDSLLGVQPELAKGPAPEQKPARAKKGKARGKGKRGCKKNKEVLAA